MEIGQIYRWNEPHITGYKSSDNSTTYLVVTGHSDEIMYDFECSIFVLDENEATIDFSDTRCSSMLVSLSWTLLTDEESMYFKMRLS
jgi:hypothetical protein